MKRVISLITVLSLVFSMFAMPAMSYASQDASIHPVAKLINEPSAEAITDAAGTSTLLPLNQGAMKIDSTTLSNTSDDSGLHATGGIVDISLSTEISPQQGINLKATIMHEGTGRYDSYTLDPVDLEMKDTAGAVNEYYARISNVDSGHHKLIVYGEGYQDFNQDVTIEDGDRIVVSLIDTTINDKTYLEKLGMGLIPYGDFDNDGVITANDGEYISKAVNRNVGAAEPIENDLHKYNLDGSDNVELNDVQIFAMNIGKHKLANTRATKDPSFMKTDASKVNLIEGSLMSDIFIDNGAITAMAPEDPSQDVSEDNPVEFEVTPAANTSMAGMVLVVPQDSEGRPTQGEIVLETDEGPVSIKFDDPTVTTRNIVRYSARMTMRAAGRVATPSANYDALNGLITINFGNQIAVKKVTIRITETSSNRLAEIAQVEFLNGMEDKIPEPELDIPKNIVATAADKKFDLTWSPCNNISGYQIEVSNGTSKLVITTDVTNATVDGLGGKKLVNGTEYNVRIRSMSESDNWFSPWSNPIKVKPIASKVPSVPERVSLSPEFTNMTVSWKAAEDAETYNVFWSVDQQNWQEVRNITSTSYLISGLNSDVGYYVQVSASNQIGDSGKSPAAFAKTKAAQVKVPWYKLINRASQTKATGQEFESDGITSVSKGAVDNNFTLNPDFKDYRDVVDGDYGTYWYCGASNSGGPKNGPIIEFDEEHVMDHFILTTYLGAGYASFASIRIYVWDAAGNMSSYWGPYENPQLVNYTSVAGAANTLKVNFPKSNVKKIQITGQRYYSSPDSTIAELAFYDYDDIKEKVAALWADDLHTTLAEGVDQATIDALRAQLETEDPLSGEKTPDYDYYDLQLKNAQTVLDHEDLREALKIDSSVDKSVNNYAGGTNAWQPLGVSVKSGDTINIYVGASNCQDGASGVGTALALYVGQQHPVCSKPVFTLSDPTLTGPNQNNHSLKTGLNSITVPEGFSQEAESGGALYVEYLSSTKTYQYNVRVEGGTKIPRLDIHGVTDESVRHQMVVDYVNDLERHVGGLEAYHNANHKDTMDGAYGVGQSCTANMTDIAINYLMYSVPASQIWNQIKGYGSTNEERATRLEQALVAGDEGMILFYQHKGLSNLAKADGDATNYGLNGLPKSRQNVRYTQMFTGAFMYAAGNHIGIEWGSVGGTVAIDGPSMDENGLWQGSGRYFGWGLNHEIGHEINQGQYAIAEVTNNYYAQLAQSHDTTETTRWTDYDNVYRKVTSGAKGAPAGKTGIAMYWQLHLAYDGMDMLASTGEKSFNYKTYDNYTDLFNNLFFARVDSYARNQSLAPSPSGIGLNLASADKDNAIIRLSCAAAQKDLRDYFVAWGLTPDADTDKYASQFPVEDRGIQYVTDEARVYQMNNYSAAAASAKPSAPSSIKVDYVYGTNTVDIDLSGCPTGDDILGYEILRNGKAVGFVKTGTGSYTDTINTINNRVFTYQIRTVNNWLNRSDLVTADPIKVHHENILDKSKWSLKTDLREVGNSNDGTFTDDQRENELDWTSDTIKNGNDTIIGCDGECDHTKLSANAAIDGDTSTMFVGETSTDDASITIDFGQSLEMTAVRYHAGSGSDPIGDYKIEISNDGKTFTTLRTGVFDINSQGYATVFFDEGSKENRLLIYDASYMRITPTSQNRVSIAEFDVLGPTGDDVDLIQNGIGILKNDTTVGTNTEGNPEVIPAGSFIVTGTYKGNPAYNVVVLYDNDKLEFDSARPQNSAIIEGSQIVFGEEPIGDEMLPDVRVGYWAYYVTPDDMKAYKDKTGSDWVAPKNVSAELYRVDDALTLEGQRQVANTLPVAVPETLPDIELQFGTPATASVFSDLGLDGIIDSESLGVGNGTELDSDASGDGQGSKGEDGHTDLGEGNSAILRDEGDFSQGSVLPKVDPEE